MNITKDPARRYFTIGHGEKNSILVVEDVIELFKETCCDVAIFFKLVE